MKKVYILTPAFISYVIVSFTALIFPANYADQATLFYGYPLAYLYVDKETTLTFKDTIIDNIAVNVLYFLIDGLVLIVVINIFIRIYKIIARKIKESKTTGAQR